MSDKSLAADARDMDMRNLYRRLPACWRGAGDEVAAEICFSSATLACSWIESKCHQLAARY